MTPTPHRQVILIDGGSGSGKTTYARRLARSLRARGRTVQLVSLDEIYPGWHGLAAASDAVVTDVLDAGRYQRWDWQHQRSGDYVTVDADADLIIEGCGAITPASAALSTRTIWLDLDAATRRRRAVSRSDAATYEPWWDTWAAQEHDHWRRHRPWELADAVIPVDAD